MLTRHVIFSEESLPTIGLILNLLVQYIHYCITHRYYHSTRARLSFGILTKVLSEAYGVETSLQWLEGLWEIVVMVCTNFKKILNLVCSDEDQEATLLQEMRNLLVSEPREFIQMLETVRGSLETWTTRVLKRDITLRELQLLQRRCAVYNHVAGLVSARDACLQGDTLNSIETEYKDIEQRLSNLFIRVVPSLAHRGW